MMKRWIVIVSIGILLLPLLGCRPAAVYAQAAPEEVALRRQVELLNLINDLELTAEQMRLVLKKAQEAQGIRKGLTAEADVMEIEAVLVEIRDRLVAGEKLPDELRKAFLTAKAQDERLARAYRGEVAHLAEEVEGILESHQLYALDRYVPRVLPSEDQLRIGRARKARGVAVLERLRRVPADRFERHKERAARWVLRELERHFHRRILILDREEELHRILDILERARSLSDAAFELEKEELIQVLLAPYEASRPPVDVTPVIGRHLLDPAIIPLLEQKLALMEG